MLVAVRESHSRNRKQETGTLWSHPEEKKKRNKANSSPLHGSYRGKVLDPQALILENAYHKPYLEIVVVHC